MPLSDLMLLTSPYSTAVTLSKFTILGRFIDRSRTKLAPLAPQNE